MAATKHSAGIVLWRYSDPSQPSVTSVEILLVHPGGPLWANKDQHGWSIPKGEYADGEDPLDTARREFTEELGHPLPPGQPVDLGELKTSSKIIRAFALQGDLDVTTVSSNTFTMQWPPRSGRLAEFPEVDRAQWFSLPTATDKLHKGQVPLVKRFIHTVFDA